jgi:hypothetical protein
MSPSLFTVVSQVVSFFLFQIEMPLQKKIETVWNEQMLPVIHIHAVLNLN